MCWLDRNAISTDRAVGALFGPAAARAGHLKRGLGLAASLRPGLRLPNELPSSSLSHDPEVCRGYDTDPCHPRGHGSLVLPKRWRHSPMSASAPAGSKLPLCSLYVPLGRPPADTSVSQQVFDRLGASDKTLTSYPGSPRDL